MIIDCHYHFETRLLTEAQLLKKMDECGVDKVALMGVMCDPLPETPEFLLKLLRFLLTHRSFRFIAKILAAKFTPEGDLKIPAGIIHLYPAPKNEPVFQAVADKPDRFLGWVFVNPRGEKDQIQELNRWKDNPGFIGVKAHPFWHRCPPVELLPVAEQLAKMGKPLLIHAGFDAHGDYDALLQKVPDLKLVLAHAGFPLYFDTWKRIKDNPNVYVDLSQTSYLNDRTTKQAVEYLGIERCLFGTDGPYGVHGDDYLFDYSFIKRRIERLFPDRENQKKLLGENFSKFIQN
ncbi:MAG: amidohydrolase family protein [Desulfobacterales bacterium]|jgi:predicted TIM-barrel fold metal-dependent hydrolase